MKKKLFKPLLLLVAAIGIFVSTENVHAETYNGDFGEGGYIESKVYINKRQSDGYTKWQRARFIIQRSTGQIVYCMQPMVDLVDGAIYNVTTEDFSGAQNLTAEQYDRIRLLAYYGYGYGNHTSTDWISVTQTLIWRTTRPDLDIYYSRSSQAKNRDDSIFASEIAELNALVANHYNRPSFNTNTIETFMGRTESINDNNNVLSQYQIKSQSNVTANISGNTLKITATNVGKGEVTFEKKEKRFGADPIIFYAIDSQNVIKPGDPKPVLAKINININGGKIKILKVDAKNNNTTVQGDATLIGAKYGVYNSAGTLVNTLIIGNDYTAISDYLELGTYTIKEIEAPTGYLLDTNTYTAVVESSDIINITVKENVVEGKIKITKQDSDNKTCKAQGDATLIGAKFGVYNKNSQLVDTLVIGDDCTATSKDLPYGKYTIKEIEPSTGYLLNTKVYNAEIKQNSDIIKLTVDETPIKGKIKLTKQDSENKSCKAQGDATLIGAKFGIYNKNSQLVDTLIIGDDCTATSKNLPYGKYTIKEIEPSIGYLLNTKVYNAEVKKNSEVVKVTVDETVIKGRIKILKFDEDNKNQNARGQATLIGAKYGVYDKNNNLVDTLVIDEKIQAISKDLPYGKYKVKEIEPSTGYEKDPKTYDVTISKNEEVIRIDSYEKVIENYISILKQYDYVDENTTFLNAESGITFEIFYPDGTKYDEITTDKNGYASIVIPYGVWKFHQVNTNTGFEKIYDFFVTVDENSEKEQYYNILNNKIAAYLQVLKVDEETGKTIAIANTKFKIYNKDTKQYVSQYVSGNVYDTFVTDAVGKFITYLKLEAGNYKLVETSSPTGYLINSDGLEFTIGDDTHYNYTTYGAIVIVRFSDKPVKGQIEINKKGENFIIKDDSFEYEEISLKGIKFEIYADEDIKSSDGNVLFYSKDKLVDTLTTDENGHAISKKLPLGKYKVVEVKTLDGYVLDSNEYKVTLKQKDNKTEIVYEILNIKNYLKKSTLEFSKTDLVTGEAIPNTIIEISNSSNKAIFRGKTDKNGKIVIKNLMIGKYTIKEIEPSTGYVLNDTPVLFEIKEDGKIVKAEMTNKPITGDLEFAKLSLSTEEPLPNTIMEIYNSDTDELVFEGKTDENGKIIIKDLRYGKYYILEKEAPEGYTINPEKIPFEIKENGEIIKSVMKDKLITGTLEFTKIDISTEEPLPNTVVEIYTETDELVFSGKTDENGKIIIKDLKYGKYYILEKEAPEGYTINPEKMPFEVKENGEIVKSVMKDEQIIDVPDTDKTDYKLVIIGGSILILLGIGIVIYGTKKRK